MSYICSSDNRIYVAREQSYGAIAVPLAKHRIPAVKLAIRETSATPVRKDKIGGRTFQGYPAGIRRNTSFELTTYMSGWADAGVEPAYAALFESAMGAPAVIFAGSTVASADNGGTIHFTSSHGLSIGQAVVIDGEMRFVAGLVDSQTVNVNAPYSTTPVAGASATPTITYGLGRDLPSLSLFDYWSPAGTVQRLLPGAAVEEFQFSVNGDFHQFEFRGPARTALDSATFTATNDELPEFPAEPDLEASGFSIVPGHLGQVWLGATPARFYSLINAHVRLKNGIELRNREFGLQDIRAIAAGQRKVTFDFDLFADSDDATRDLFQASRQRSPIAAMIQLGQQTGQLFGAYLKSVVPEAANFDDAETRLQWRFKDSRAQGTTDDELVIAIG